MKVVLVAVIVAGVAVFTVHYSPRRIVARARARGVYIPPQAWEFGRNERSFLP